MADVTFKNPDGSASNVPLLVPSEGEAPVTDSKTGEVVDPVQTVDLNAIQCIEEEAKHAIDELLHHNPESEPTNG
jgi:hypothetical protein